MACDFSVAQDLALFGQAGPRHGSAPDGGSTDFLPLFVGIEAAMESCTLCEHWSAHKAQRLGLVTDGRAGAQGRRPLRAEPARRSPTAGSTTAQIVYGELKTGAEREAGKALLARGEVDLARLDAAVDALVFKLANTMPGCLSKTIESVRKHKLEHWDRNKETQPRVARR